VEKRNYIKRLTIPPKNTVSEEKRECKTKRERGVGKMSVSKKKRGHKTLSKDQGELWKATGAFRGGEGLEVERARGGNMGRQGEKT